MKKKTRDLFKMLGPVKLYYDDIEKIVSTLKEVNDNITLEGFDFYLDNIEELKDINETVLTELKISIRKPNLSVYLKPDGVSIYAGEDTAIHRGLFEEIKNQLKKHRRPFSLITHNTTVAFSLAGALIGISISLITKTFTSFEYYRIIACCIIILASVVWSKITYSNRNNKYSIIYPKRRKEAPNFLKRQKDQIILALISAIFGALFTLLIIWLFG